MALAFSAGVQGARLRQKSVAESQQQQFDDSDESANDLMADEPAIGQSPRRPPSPQGRASPVALTQESKQPTGVTRPKGWDQCLKFARYTKSQDITGTELVRVWKSTCEPAVQSGAATERYRLMCNSLSGAVEPYASQLNYNVEALCDSVLSVFHDVPAVER